MERRGRGRARVAVREAPNRGLVWLFGLLLAGAVMGSAFGQTTPEVVRPGSGGAVMPPSAGDGRAVPQPRSENPLAGGSTRPVPDNGVIAPPVAGTPMAVRPPATGTMPVIPPPGSAGGDRTVVPK